MQLNSAGLFKIIFKDGKSIDIKIYEKLHSNFIKFHKGTGFIGTNAFYSIYIRGKPIAFELIKLNTKPNSPELIKWINEEFKPIFDYDPLKWLASVGTCIPELRKHLKDFYDR